MSDTVVLDGTCTLESRLDGTCSLNSLLDGSAISILKVNDFAYYTGQYVVTPLAETQVILPTNGLMMSDDVTVTKVPYYEVSNIYGDTVYIASEVNDGN